MQGRVLACQKSIVAALKSIVLEKGCPWYGRKTADSARSDEDSAKGSFMAVNKLFTVYYGREIQIFCSG